MKTMKLLAVGVAVLVSAACGRSSERQLGVQKDGSTYAELRVQGDLAGSFTSVLVGIADVRIVADGQPVAVKLDASTKDLARAGAWRVGAFDLPKGAQTVDVVL